MIEPRKDLRNGRGPVRAWRPMTRRGFARTLVGGSIAGLVANQSALAAAAPFTLAMVPDPQFLAGDRTCSSQAAYDALVAWAITHAQTSVNGVALNIKGFIQAGDCVNTAIPGTDGGNADTQRSRMVHAWAQPFAATPKQFVAFCPGNHDYLGAGGGRDLIGYAWRADTAGEWSPTNLAAMYGAGLDLGSGDSAVWGGTYTEPVYTQNSANSYIRINVSGLKILVISLEYWPRSAVLDWAKTLHDTYTDHLVWVTTHGYMMNSGERAGWDSQYGPGPGGFPSTGGAANAGDTMWSSWFAGWSRLAWVTSAHWIDTVNPASATNWVVQKRDTIATHGNRVQEVFCNCQELDGSAGICNAGPVPNGTGDSAHLLLMRFNNPVGSQEAFLVSTNSGKWSGPASGTGALLTQQTSPIQLWQVPMPGGMRVGGGMRMSGGMVIR